MSRAADRLAISHPVVSKTIADLEHALGVRLLDKVKAVLGDGADWIWRYAWQFLGRRGVEVVEIVDIFHAWGHLWTVANAGGDPSKVQYKLFASGQHEVLGLARSDEAAKSLDVVGCLKG